MIRVPVLKGRGAGLVWWESLITHQSSRASVHELFNTRSLMTRNGFARARDQGPRRMVCVL